MEPNSVKQFVGKLCRIILKNNYNYTAVIPQIDGEAFTIIDKFGDAVEIDCSFIGVIQVINKDNAKPKLKGGAEKNGK